MDCLEECGAGTRTRTEDLLITNQLLYQLSYAGPAWEHKIVAHEVTGPATAGPARRPPVLSARAGPVHRRGSGPTRKPAPGLRVHSTMSDSTLLSQTNQRHE